MDAAFLGLGRMGSPMAANLLKEKVSLFVYNRSPEKMEPLVKLGARALSAPEKAFQKTDIAFTMVTNDEALESMAESLLKTIKPGDIHVSMSSVSPDLTRKLEERHREKKAFYIAAPVFGRPEMAKLGKLWIAFSGEKAAKEKIVPLLGFMGCRVADFGEKASFASLVKLAGNFTVLSALEAMGEAYFAAKKSGIDVLQLAEFFGNFVFSSPLYAYYGETIAREEFPTGSTHLLPLKDLKMMQKAAKDAHMPLPLGDLLRRHLEKGIEEGREKLDWSAVSLSARDSQST